MSCLKLEVIGAQETPDQAPVYGGTSHRHSAALDFVLHESLIIHFILNWLPERAITILRNCRKAMKKTSRLLLVETIITVGNDLYVGKFVDFIMLTIRRSERTEEESENLLQEAGFHLNQVVPTVSPFGMSIIEGVLDDGKH